MPVTRRSQARMLALQALCAFEAVGESFGEHLNEFFQDEHTLDDLGIDLHPPAELLSFARTLALGAQAQRGVLDDKLTRTAAHWSVSRMTPVDRNILRLGLHELLEHPETPPQIVINEAIELARRFGDTDSPAFVNGVLDAVRRACAEPNRSQAEGPTKPQANHDTEGGDATA